MKQNVTFMYLTYTPDYKNYVHVMNRMLMQHRIYNTFCRRSWRTRMERCPILGACEHPKGKRHPGLEVPLRWKNKETNSSRHGGFDGWSQREYKLTHNTSSPNLCSILKSRSHYYLFALLNFNKVTGLLIAYKKVSFNTENESVHTIDSRFTF